MFAEIARLQVVHDGFVPLITQLYAKDDPYLRDYATCTVVNPLVMKFKPRHGDSNATLDLEYDFPLAPTNTWIAGKDKFLYNLKCRGF